MSRPLTCLTTPRLKRIAGSCVPEHPELRLAEARRPCPRSSTVARPAWDRVEAIPAGGVGQQGPADAVKAAKGLGGKERSLGPASPAERAADAVRKVLDRAYKKMKPSMPGLVDHLKKSLKPEGITYAYYPPAPVPGWEF